MILLHGYHERAIQRTMRGKNHTIKSTMQLLLYCRKVAKDTSLLQLPEQEWEENDAGENEHRKQHHQIDFCLILSEIIVFIPFKHNSDKRSSTYKINYEENKKLMPGHFIFSLA